MARRPLFTAALLKHMVTPGLEQTGSGPYQGNGMIRRADQGELTMPRFTFATGSACLLLASVAAAEPVGSSEIRVTDGDTILAHGKVYRLVGFNAPETFKARCADERTLGVKARARLQALINAGALDLTEVQCSCAPGTEGTQSCNYGRSCATLKANGIDVGQTLIKEGLAEVYVCGRYRCPKRRDWCGGAPR